MQVEVISGRYKGIKDAVVVNSFPNNKLVRTTTTNLGGRYQEHYHGHIVKVANECIKEIK